MMLVTILNRGTHLAALVMVVLTLLASTNLAADLYCPMKFKRIDEHSACLQPASQAINEGVSDADKLIIVQRHNEHRGAVQPPSDNMLKMYWDDEVAQIAQGWAHNCNYSHDGSIRRNIPGRFALGQNIGIGHNDWTEIIDYWHDEYKQFTYQGGDQTGVGHYTQIVWAGSSALGCGFAECAGRPNYVCNYGPSGNVLGSKGTPYESGSTIDASCPSYQDGNLCDCGSNTCANGGTMDLVTCKCECVQGTIEFIQGELCSLNCTLAAQNALPYCGQGGYVSSNCATTLNVPYECPFICDVCPYGDEVFDDQVVQISCSTGSPLPDIFCGRGPATSDCPDTHHCVIDPLDRWAVCCPKTVTDTIADSSTDGYKVGSQAGDGTTVVQWSLLVETMVLLTTIHVMTSCDVV